MYFERTAVRGVVIAVNAILSVRYTNIKKIIKGKKLLDIGLKDNYIGIESVGK